MAKVFLQLKLIDSTGTHEKHNKNIVMDKFQLNNIHNIFGKFVVHLKKISSITAKK